MAVFVSSSVASMVNVPIVGDSASFTDGVEVEAFDSVQDTCTCVFLSCCKPFSQQTEGTSFCASCGASRTVLMACAIGLAYGIYMGVIVHQFGQQVGNSQYFVAFWLIYIQSSFFVLVDCFLRAWSNFLGTL